MDTRYTQYCGENYSDEINQLYVDLIISIIEIQHTQPGENICAARAGIGCSYLSQKYIIGIASDQFVYICSQASSGRKWVAGNPY